MAAGSSRVSRPSVTVVDEAERSGGLAPSGQTAPPSPSLIDAALAVTDGAGRSAADRLAAFLSSRSAAEGLPLWFGQPREELAKRSKDQVARFLTRDIARIDELLSGQVNAILHHPSFQRLEASWRGLEYLTRQGEGVENLKIRVLNVSWRELTRDLDRAIEFDQSQLFKKVYSEEFDTPGGEPYGVLIGDYEITHRIGPDHPTDDVAALAAISQVAAAAFAPFIAAVDPSLFGLESFADLERPMDLARGFEQAEYLKWRTFRETEDARFVGLAAPRILMRLPYEDRGDRVDGFRFREDVEGPDRSKYLWGNVNYAFGAVLIRAFAESGWLADIRGVQRGQATGGIVTGLPVQSFSTDSPGVAQKCSTDVIMTDDREKELGDLGFIPLCHAADTEFSAFYGNQSVQKPKKYDEQAATINARISSMLQYMLCVSRFAHYLKVIGRDKVGSFAEASDVEDFLHRWIQQYVIIDDNASDSVKAEYPLREAKIEVRERPGKPGNYVCVAHLRPHFQLDELVASVRLVTELSPPRGT